VENESTVVDGEGDPAGCELGGVVRVFFMGNLDCRGRELAERRGVFGGTERFWLKFGKCR